MSLFSFKPKILIPQHVYKKINYWVQACPIEVSGFGDVDFNGREFVIRDAYLLPQKSTGSETEMDQDAINAMAFEKFKDEGAMKWHWHSHVNMNVFYSTTDMELYRQLGHNGWIIATVFNKKGEKKSCYLGCGERVGYLWEDFVDDLPTEIGSPLTDEEAALLKAQLEENVEEKKTVVTKLPATNSYYPSPYWTNDYKKKTKKTETQMELGTGSLAPGEIGIEYDENGSFTYINSEGEEVVGWNPLEDPDNEEDIITMTRTGEVNEMIYANLMMLLPDEFTYLYTHDDVFREIVQEHGIDKAYFEAAQEVGIPDSDPFDGEGKRLFAIGYDKGQRYEEYEKRNGSRFKIFKEV